MFGFPQTDHTTYKKNFLKTVILQIAYEDNAHVVERKKEVFNIFRETFPRTNENVTSGVQVSFSPKEKTPILEPIKNSNALDLKSGDGQKIISINSSSLTATYNGTVYKNFQKLLGRAKYSHRLFQPA